MDFIKSSGKMFNGVFNPQKKETCNIGEVIKKFTKPEINKSVGKEIKIDNKTIYPIIQTSVIRGEKGFTVAEIFPIALVVEENNEKYVISVFESLDDPEIFIEMVKKVMI